MMGQGVKQSYEEAVKWYRLAAAQGEAMAQVNLGYMYATGQGVGLDELRALMWFYIAADSGDAKALDLRERSSKAMKPEQVSQAQRMARECQKRKLIGCD